ncbi:alpha-L-rhamnosidase C-terminal domain-containing protein [Compostibacter hankyongensis]
MRPLFTFRRAARKWWLAAALVLAAVSPAFPQDVQISPSLLSGQWNAHWISCPGIAPRDYGVYHFRKTLLLPAKPGHFTVHVSADNRYRLYVNGTPVGRGPARGDLYHWCFESYDLAPYLKAGKNVIAALVWNMGVDAPVAQLSNQTAFLLQGDTRAEQSANSDNTWQVYHDTAYRSCATDMGALLHSYTAVGVGDEVNGAVYPWGWEQPGYDDASWLPARVLPAMVAITGYGTDNLWTLVPRTIPQPEERLQRLQAVRRATVKDAGDFIRGQSRTLPPHSNIRILLDQRFETNAYPVLKVSGGKGASIRLTYAEALFDAQGRKGNRNEVDGKDIRGLYDIFYPDGGAQRIFSPLWFRTYRYLQLDIRTGGEPLTIDDLYGLYTAYPFEHKATFASSDSSLKAIWETGWRTARLCAGETYFDCPYYEQLQYEADTRIQALISLYNAGDDRLMRKAINDFYNSRVPEGLTQGRYPSSRLQVIPTFSLFWVSMLYDYWMHRTDDAFLEKYLDAAARVLKWYAMHVDSSRGMLGPMKWWNFTDWNNAFSNGVPDGATDGHSAVITLQYAYTLNQASALFAYFGRKEEAERYRRLAASLAQHTYRQCFDATRMEMANTPEKQAFSQHAGIMAVLADAVPADEQQKVMRRILDDSTLSQATFYYRFYLTRALVKAGMGNLYYGQLKPWREMLKNGLTTFAENPDPTRSDCHAWSASPNYDFLATLCGIMPSAPGFKTVSIAPEPGSLREIKASMPHPYGTLSVHLRRSGEHGIHAEIVLPGRLTGTFRWQGKTVSLKPGKQTVDL